MQNYSRNWLTSLTLTTLLSFCFGVTMKQFDASLDMMRSGCAPKFNLKTETLDNIRKGIFEENNKDLKVLPLNICLNTSTCQVHFSKCYAKCIAQLAGTLTKKGEFSFQKALAQIPIILPAEIQEDAKKALEACIDTQKGYSDSCDKIFYTTKCVHDFNPKQFKFP